MQEIKIPPDAVEYEEFQFVLLSSGGPWRPALLERWWKLPDGRWACRLRIPGHKAPRGRVTLSYTVLYDPTQMRPLTSFDIVQAE